MSSKVGVLAHYQPAGIRPSTHVPAAAADELVQRMICERISRKLIRMLPPDSVFQAARRAPQLREMQLPYIPERLGPGEIANVRWQPPESAKHPTTIPRLQHLPRYREVYGDLQLALSLGQDRCSASLTT